MPSADKCKQKPSNILVNENCDLKVPLTLLRTAFPDHCVDL